MLKRIVVLLFFVQVSFGQDYGNKVDAMKLCTSIQGNNFINDVDAEKALNRILDVIGASKRFVLLKCDNINNAIATAYKGIRYILYDTNFMNSLDTGNNWSDLFILAHEVGHHINGHSLDLVLYATEVVEPESLSVNRQQELEADEFAGFILSKLGASFEETIAVINLLPENQDDEFSTHPSRAKRLDAVKNGYSKALGNETVIYETPNNIQKAEEYFYSAVSKQQLGLDYDAISDYTKSIELNSAISEAYYNRALVKHKLKDYSGALSDYTKAIELNPNDAEYYNSRGVTKQYLKDYYGSVTDLTKAIEIDSSYDTAYFSRGATKYSLKDYSGSISDFNKAIKLNPNFAQAYRGRGLSKQYLKDYYGSISDYTRAIMLNPNDASVYYNRGVSKYSLKDYNGSILDYTIAIMLNPNDASAYYARARSKAYNYDKNGACKDARKAQRLGYDASQLINIVCN